LQRGSSRLEIFQRFIPIDQKAAELVSVKKSIIFPAPIDKSQILKLLFAQFPGESQLTLAKLADLSDSTLSAWKEHPGQLVAFTHLLERLSPDRRRQILDRVCRERATLDHPALRFEAVAVGSLRTIARKSAGLTLVRSEFLNERVFITYALADELQSDQPNRVVLHGLWGAGRETFCPVYSMIAEPDHSAADLMQFLKDPPILPKTTFLVEAIDQNFRGFGLLGRLSENRHVVVCGDRATIEKLQTRFPKVEMIHVSSRDEQSLQLEITSQKEPAISRRRG
jgi:hypothetical protein